MRVVRRVHRSERGAVLVIVAVFALVAVVFLAFVIDIGNQRQDRRQLTTATDASALDVASEWADLGLASSTFPGADCSAQAVTYLNRNRAENPDGHSCVATKVNGQFASVSVFANASVDYRFGRAIGINEGLTNATTSVVVSSTDGGGLRPFAVCANDSVVLKTWIDAWQSATPPAPTDFIVGGPKFLSTGCGENNGNWGMFAFLSQAGGTSGLADAIASGSTDATITIDQSVTGDAVTECNKSYAAQQSENGISCVFQTTGNPWTNNPVLSAFGQLKTDGTIFNLPVYDTTVDLGGSSTGFPVIGFIEVQLLSYCGDPNPTLLAQAEIAAGACSGGKDNFVHIRVNKLTSGQCCDVNKDNKSLAICDVGDVGGNIDLAALLQNCQTAAASSGPPPSFPDHCSIQSVSTPTPSVTLDGDERLTADVDFTVTVADSSDCGAITVDATSGGTTNVADMNGPTGNSWTATFTIGTKFKNNKVFAIGVNEDGSLADDSATLETKKAP